MSTCTAQGEGGCTSATPLKLRPHALDASVVAEIRRQNALELEVYRVAGHLLDAQVARARAGAG